MQPAFSPSEALASVDALLRRVAQRFACAGADAEDLWQEARVAFVESLPRYAASRSPLAAWAGAQARSACLDYLREKRLLIYYPRAYHDAGTAQDAAGGLLEAEQREVGHDPCPAIEGGVWVEQMLSRLTEAQRRVMRLHLAGENDSQIGRAIGLHDTTVRHHRLKAAEILRRECSTPV